jgi:hypothetical protein
MACDLTGKPLDWTSHLVYLARVIWPGSSDRLVGFRYLNTTTPEFKKSEMDEAGVRDRTWKFCLWIVWDVGSYDKNTDFGSLFRGQVVVGF